MFMLFKWSICLTDTDVNPANLPDHELLRDLANVSGNLPDNKLLNKLVNFLVPPDHLFRHY